MVWTGLGEVSRSCEAGLGVLGFGGVLCLLGRLSQRLGVLGQGLVVGASWARFRGVWGALGKGLELIGDSWAESRD